ncbi:7363_t:CDS:10 [Entrophospora sp. SA101]|nr:7363_t:CDS:10 [Entrophospora sp. SA101]
MSGNINNDAIDQFRSLTNASFEEAQSYLTATDDNIELAVLLYFGDDIQAPPQSSHEELAKLLYQQEEKAAGVRAPIPPRSDILFGNVNGGGSYSIPNARRSREQQHRTFAGDIRKWIMINIQSIGEFSSQALNRDLWSNDTVKDIIRAHFCFLQYNSDSTDGSKYINFYPVYKYPHVAVIDPRTVWDSQLEPTEFIINVTDFLDKYSLNEEPNHSESSTAKKTSDGTSEMSVDDQSKAEPQISNDTGGDDQNTFLKKEKEVPKVHPVFEEIPYKSIFDSIKPIERPDQTGPKSTSIKFRLEGRHVIKKFNKKDPVRYMFEYLKASVPELNDKFFELNYLRNNLIEKIDETIEEAGLINAAINVVLG